MHLLFQGSGQFDPPDVGMESDDFVGFPDDPGASKLG